MWSGFPHCSVETPAGLVRPGHLMHSLPHQGHRLSGRRGRSLASGLWILFFPLLPTFLHPGRLVHRLGSPGRVHGCPPRMVGVFLSCVQALGPSDTHSDTPGWITALISVAASLFPILCESHALASRVTKVISREDLGLPCVTSCHPHSLLFWTLPSCNSVR